MLELCLLRHAKSSWAEKGLEDHERDLNKRGFKAARSMGALIAERGWTPERVLCSSAVRTRRTLELIAQSFAFEPSVMMLKELYLAEPEEMLRIVRAQPESATRLLLIGHNPGMQSFAVGLLRGGEAHGAGVGAGAGDAGVKEVAKAFPTAALARISFDLDAWDGVDWGEGHLETMIRPREL